MNYSWFKERTTFIFKNILGKRKNSLINLNLKQNKLDKEIEHSLKILNNFSERFKPQIHPFSNKKEKLKEINLKKSNSEKKIIPYNLKANKNNKYPFLNKLKKSKTSKLNDSFNNDEKKKDLIQKSRNNKKNKIKHIKYNYHNRTNISILLKEQKEVKIKYRKVYSNLLKDLNGNLNIFKRNPSFNLIFNYSKNNYAKSTSSSRLSEKPKIFHENKNYSLVFKKEKKIIKNTKSIEKDINQKLHSEKKFYIKRKDFHSAKERNIKKYLNESKFIENINRKEKDDIKNIKHIINFKKLKKDLNFISELNTSVVYSQRNFLIQKFGEYKENKKNKEIY